MRARQFSVLLGVLVLAALSIYHLRRPYFLRLPPPAIIPHTSEQPTVKAPAAGQDPETQHDVPSQSHRGETHPIRQLVNESLEKQQQLIARQSKTLAEAVTEYRLRYGIPPPPNFDKWYEFAKAKGVQLIDEYDSIHQTLTPFWALKPSTIRGRAREALGFKNFLIGALVRNGKVTKIEGGDDWQRDATVGMMKSFMKYLPDMDLCFNIHDESRVMVPYDDLTRLVGIAKNKNMPAANNVPSPRNSWAKRPADLGDGTRFEDVRRTRFNVFAHQPTWTHSRMSCPPDSPARNLEDGPPEDNYESYGVGDLGFIRNQTAFSDICQSPSLRETHGFFDRPNAFNIVHDLFPIFSQSKMSSFNDILYPSPWYWAGKVTYKERLDMPWINKENKIYWRGSTTGGFSRDGGWRRQHRQRVVQKMNSGDQAKILVNHGGADAADDWKVEQVPRSEFKDIFDVHFSHIGQCDPGDCDAQREFFDVKEAVEQQVLGKSKSLVYKLAVFREWHEEWLKPWVHFIPLSLRGDEWVEAVKWFAGEPKGQHDAEMIAIQGRDWARKVLRKDDLEVWFFRLLLEYGRVVDDDREIIGYAGP